MSQETSYTGLRDGYVLLPFPEDKQLNPKDIDWRIEFLLGKGNFGQVVRGTWKGKPSALKIANPYNGMEAIDLLKEEATIMMRLNHPNILTVYGCATKHDHFVMVMELMNQSFADLLDKLKEQNELQSKLEDGTMDIEDLKRKKSNMMKIENPPILHILRDAVTGLQYLHQQNLIHRDIKPSNILLTKDYVGKLCDFGLVRKMDLQGNMTNAGSGAYKAPEVNYGDGHYDTSVDIFSIGRVIEKDILPVVNTTELRELADYCLQPLPDVPCTYDEPSKRPTATQLLKRIRTLIRKLEPSSQPKLVPLSATSSSSNTRSNPSPSSSLDINQHHNQPSPIHQMEEAEETEEQPDDDNQEIPIALRRPGRRPISTVSNTNQKIMTRSNQKRKSQQYDTTVSSSYSIETTNTSSATTNQHLNSIPTHTNPPHHRYTHSITHETPAKKTRSQHALRLQQQNQLTSSAQPTLIKNQKRSSSLNAANLTLSTSKTHSTLSQQNQLRTKPRDTHVLLMPSKSSIATSTTKTIAQVTRGARHRLKESHQAEEDAEDLPYLPSDAALSVYIAMRRGNKFHLAEGHMKATRVTTLARAAELGYKPCSVCCADLTWHETKLSRHTNSDPPTRNTRSRSRSSLSIDQNHSQDEEMEANGDSMDIDPPTLPIDAEDMDTTDETFDVNNDDEEEEGGGGVEDSQEEEEGEEELEDSQVQEEEEYGEEEENNEEEEEEYDHMDVDAPADSQEEQEEELDGEGIVNEEEGENQEYEEDYDHDHQEEEEQQEEGEENHEEDEETNLKILRLQNIAAQMRTSRDSKLLPGSPVYVNINNNSSYHCRKGHGDAAIRTTVRKAEGEGRLPCLRCIK